MRGLRQVLRDLWEDAEPLTCWGLGWRFYPDPVPAWYRRAVMVPRWLRRVAVRFRAVRHLLTAKREGESLDTPLYRLKALVLLWGPVVWEFPYYAGHKHCDEVLGWDARTWNGGEMTCWDATFVAVPYGLRLGRAHLYREGGP